MADVKISELSALTSPDGAEELVVNASGTTKKITIDNLFNQDIDVTGTVTSDGLGLGDSDAIVWGAGTSRPAIVGNKTTGDLNLYTNGSSRLSINNSGSVGIGTSSPSSNLDLRTTTSTTLNIQGGDGNSKNITFKKNTGDTVEGKIKVYSDIMSFETAGSEAMRISATGNVGIGLSSNIGATLHVDPAANVTTGFGTPLIKVGGANSWAGTGSLYSIGFGYTVSAAGYSPAEIGLVTTSGSSHTKGALVFATRDSGSSTTVPTERMRIDSAGIVTKPYQPSFGARGLSNAQSGGGTTGTNHTLVFSSANNNTGNHYSTSTGLFTAPVAGRYFVTFSGLYNASNNNTGPVYLMRNGSEKYRAYHDDSGTNYEQISVSGIMDVSANDTISVYSVIAGWHVGGETSFSGYLIG